MDVLFGAWFSMLASWFPTWGEQASYDPIDGFLFGTDGTLFLLENLGSYTLPDYLYLIGCILIVVLSLVALFALFKWMFTLVWRLFKID